MTSPRRSGRRRPSPAACSTSAPPPACSPSAGNSGHAKHPDLLGEGAARAPAGDGKLADPAPVVVIVPVGMPVVPMVATMTVHFEARDLDQRAVIAGAKRVV